MFIPDRSQRQRARPERSGRNSAESAGKLLSPAIRGRSAAEDDRAGGFGPRPGPRGGRAEDAGRLSEGSDTRKRASRRRDFARAASPFVPPSPSAPTGLRSSCHPRSRTPARLARTESAAEYPSKWKARSA